MQQISEWSAFGEDTKPGHDAEQAPFDFKHEP